MDLNEAAVFVKVVQLGSFSAAARQLGLPTSTVSNRVARLEKRLGVTLLQRTTRRLNLTEVGQLYFQHALTGLGHLLAAEAAVSATATEAKGRLRVTAPADLGDDLLAQMICEVKAAHPQIEIELILTDRYIDFIAEGVDVAIRTGALPDSSLVAKKVGVACWALFASPDYLQSAPPLTTPHDLAQHTCLQFTPLGKEEWTLLQADEAVTIPMKRSLLVNHIGLIRKMAQAGVGVALLPTYLCQSELAANQLLRILPTWYAKTDPVHLVYPQQKYLAPKLRAFLDIAAIALQRGMQNEI